VSAPTRECKGCGGSGSHVVYECSRHVYMDDGSIQEVNGETIVHPCPACQGTGRQSDVIPARDAMVDAETLRFAAVWWRSPLGGMPYGMGPYYNTLRRSLNDAGGRTHDDVCPWVWTGCLNWPDVAANNARLAARAAFRAIPALRSE
jgi:hypothetical protein